MIIKFSYKLCKIIFILCCIILIGCRKEIPSANIKIANNTVLVYMAANNNLKTAAINSINEMEMSAKDLDGDLFVLIKTSGYRSDLLKIKYDKTDNIVSDTVKTYGNENTSNPDFLKKVIIDAKKDYPSHSFGLVLWSHGSSWFPPQKNAPVRPILYGGRVLLKSFGYDRGEVMDVIDLKRALPDDLKFILFDACSMGSLEVAYELRHNTAYIIASPTETLSNSFPYDKITPLLFGTVDDYKLICQQYLESYRSRSGIYQSASVSLIKTDELNDLAIAVKKLLDLVPPRNINDKRAGVQNLSFDINSPVPAYDFLDFLHKNFNISDYSPVEQQFHKAIIYKGATERFLDKPIDQFGGLSTYLPLVKDKNIDYYRQLSWFTSAGYGSLFK